MNDSTDILWVAIPPPFGEAHEFGCCNAFVVNSSGGTACGWPRNSDGSCGYGHPAMPRNAISHSIRDLVAASRVASA